MSSDFLYVFKNNRNQTLCGKLVFNFGLIEFFYAKSYLEEASNLPINPFHLPLENMSRVFTEDALHGVLFTFADALPGQWGRAVMESIANKTLGDIELLLCDQKDRVGELVFSRDRTFPILTGEGIQEPFSWEELIAAKEQIENKQPLTERQRFLIKDGTSQGGARPKFCLTRNNELYLVKMPSRLDYNTNNQQIEHGSLQLARQCGIRTVSTELFRADERNFLIVKRFDRNADQEGIPFLSLASVCAIKRIENASYLDFAEEITRIGMFNELPELFRRMLFNILISNKDDHYFNHGIVFCDKRWQLSPAFDVVAGEGNLRSQSLIVGHQGRESTLRNAISSCRTFRLTTEQAMSIAQEMVSTIDMQWRAVFSDAGVDTDVINSIEWAILHPDIFLGLENLMPSTQDLR